MTCNGLCCLCGRCRMGRIVLPKKETINEETVIKMAEKENLPVIAEYGIVKSFGKEKVRRLK